MQNYKTFKEFYPFYLDQHKKTGTRITHFVGTTAFFILVLISIIYKLPWILLAGVVSAYFFAWIGHFFIEKNKPATFQYPFYSLISDFKLYFQLLTGKEKF
jgi:hypothetical protein